MKEKSIEFDAGTGKISKAMGVFYNPLMKFNRDITIDILNASPNEKFIAGLPLSASGIRGIRILKEVNKDVEVHFNDYSVDAVKIIKKNLKKNKIKSKVKSLKSEVGSRKSEVGSRKSEVGSRKSEVGSRKSEVGSLKSEVRSIDFGLQTSNFRLTCLDANEFLLKSKGFSFIDIDPFGSPNPFLDAAVKRLARNGIIAVTATDTAPLAGTYPNACKRKYWATPVRNEFMHETGIRILIRKVQLIGVQYEKALTPIFSYYKDHYYRIFFSCKKSKTGADKLLKQYGFLAGCKKCLKRYSGEVPEKCTCKTKLDAAGPLWLGSLWDKTLVKNMIKISEHKIFLETILEEARVGGIGIHDLGFLGRMLKLSSLPKKKELIEKLNKKGFKAGKTHITPEGFIVNKNPPWKKLFKP